ncbi:MAG TPA: type II toxin-antitoxin system HicB family antitoxin [Thermoanaerobaculia bacterium]|jgi:predicted RNase H-like HicB family nuclease
MSDYHINIFWSDEDAAYVADIPDLDSCSALGHSPEEALAEVERAKEAWLAAARESLHRSLTA